MGSTPGDKPGATTPPLVRLPTMFPLPFNFPAFESVIVLPAAKITPLPGFTCSVPPSTDTLPFDTSEPVVEALPTVTAPVLLIVNVVALEPVVNTAPLAVVPMLMAAVPVAE